LMGLHLSHRATGFSEMITFDGGFTK